MEEKQHTLAWGIAYCLAYDRGMAVPDLERLQVLVSEEDMPQGSSDDVVSLIAEAARRIVSPIDGSEKELEGKKEALKSRLTQLSEWLNSPHITLVMGGATKIKSYVFESARLPEIRGASGLLDRINLYDVRALYSRNPSWLRELCGKGSVAENEVAHAQSLVEKVRASFKNRNGIEPPDCEDSLIYANGGEVLAFAPVKIAAKLADEIEEIYARETLVAQSVAVYQAFTLMQLRKGLNVDSPLTGVQTGVVRELLGCNPADNKTFGSLIAFLALAKFRRREGNPDPDDRRTLNLRSLAHFETMPFERRCSSCERRGAVVVAPVASEPRPLCEPCARKRIFGQLTKKAVADVAWWNNEKFRWNPGHVRSWGKEFMDVHPEIGEITPPDDLNEIGEASKPEGFIGVVYADGNNMGQLLEALKTPADYHEFAEKVYVAIVRDAVDSTVNPGSGLVKIERLKALGAIWDDATARAEHGSDVIELWRKGQERLKPHP